MINFAKYGKTTFGNIKMTVSRRTELKGLKKLTKDIKINQLTPNEIKIAKEYWSRLPVKLHFEEFNLFKTLSGFDKKFLPIDLYYPYIKKSLNPDDYTFALGHKGMFTNFYPGFRQPVTIVLKIRGTYFDQNRQIISKEKAVQLLKAYNKCIIKPTFGTKCGKGVSILTPSKIDVTQELELHGEDFIIQEILQQSEQTAQFNPHSLNTFRVTSLFLNGEVSICAISLKFAQGDSVVDNLRAGGLMISVDENGQFHEFALDHAFNKHFETSDHQKFSSFKIPQVGKIVELIKDQHPKALPNLGIVGWDIALDQDNHPVLIEPNVWYPGIQFSQHCAQRPIFGERTDEVIEYVVAHPPILY